MIIENFLEEIPKSVMMTKAMIYPKTPKLNPRQLALDHLCQVGQSTKALPLKLDSLEEYRDRALAMELVNGVLRHRELLDWIIFRYAKANRKTIPLITLNALRLGAFQLIFLDRVPPFAAVNETVELVKKSAGIKAAHFSNAILRTIQREGIPDQDRIPRSPVEEISLETSHPKWIVKRWIARWGEEKTKNLCLANNKIPPVTVRVNPLKGNRETLIQDLEREEIKAHPSPITPSALHITEKNRVLESRAFQKGRFYIQDEGAQWIAPFLSPKPGSRILDVCSAPGGKTTHLAELMENQGEIVACEIDAERLEVLKQNLHRLEINNVKPYLWNAIQKIPVFKERDFDGAMIDAPCSGLGVLRRHPEGKWNKKEAMIGKYASIQIKLLERVAPLIKPGGRIIYSTCSTEPEENENLVNRFLKNYPSYRLEEALQTSHPGAKWFRTTGGNFSTLFNPWEMDNFFAAKLRRLD